jgi:hypothetical protein
MFRPSLNSLVIIFAIIVVLILKKLNSGWEASDGVFEAVNKPE